MAYGAIEGQRGRNFQAVEHLRDAESRLLLEDEHDSLLPNCRVHLSDCLMKIGRLGEAQDAIELAIEGYRAANDELGVANSLLALGGLHLRTNKLERAQLQLEAAAERFRVRGVRFGLAEADNRLGEVARLRGDHEKATIHYRRALSGLTSIGSSEAIIPRLNLGLLQIDQGNYAAARAVLTPGLENAQNLGRLDLENGVKVMLLPCFAHARDWPLFDTYLTAARNHVRLTGMVQPDLARLCEQAAHVCIERGQEHRAKKAAKMSLHQWMRLDNREAAKRLRALIAKLDD